MYTCAQLHMYLMCACLWRPEHIHLWMSSSGTQSVSLETRSFISLELTSWARLSELRGPPSSGIDMHAATPGFDYMVLGIELRISCVQGKHSTN